MHKFVLVVPVFLLAFTLQAQNIQMQRTDKGFWINEDDNRIMFFQRHSNDSIPEFSRSNYFHPVYDLNGNIITEDFPEGHPHHRGIFWAWLHIIVNGKNIADTWHLQNFSQNVEQMGFKTNAEGNGELEYSSFWYTKNRPQIPFMREKNEITIYKRKRNYRQIDFQIELVALEHGLEIGGSADEKGYGGFSIRMNTNENTHFSDSEKQSIEPQNTAIDAGSCVSISNRETKSGVSIISHPLNPGMPAWILRQTGSMQNCAWPGSSPVALPVNQPLTLKYTLIIHKGNPKRVPLERIYKSMQ